MDLTDVYVVLPAGGCGVRMDMETPKQYCKVLNKPIILYTILSFHRMDLVKHIVVVVSDQYMKFMEDLVTKYKLSKVRLVEGSTTRHRSIFNGVKALETVCKPDDVVLIHDAVRMFTDEHTITQVAMAAKQHKASGVYRSLVSTVISPDSDGFLEESLDRNKYRASEMPQGFHLDVILSAYKKATDYDFDYGTECLLLASKYSGVKAKLIEGSSNLWKVTHKKDLYAAEGTLKELCRDVCIRCEDVPMKESLTNELKKNNFVVIPSDSDNKTSPSVVIEVLTFDPNISMTCESCIKHFSDIDQSKNYPNSLLHRVLVFVVKLSSDSDYVSLIQLMQRLRKDMNEESLLYCVAFKENNDEIRVSEMVTRVVWNRDPVLSGQVLCVLT